MGIKSITRIVGEWPSVSGPPLLLTNAVIAVPNHGEPHDYGKLLADFLMARYNPTDQSLISPRDWSPAQLAVDLIVFLVNHQLQPTLQADGVDHYAPWEYHINCRIQSLLDTFVPEVTICVFSGSGFRANTRNLSVDQFNDWTLQSKLETELP